MRGERDRLEAGDPAFSATALDYAAVREKVLEAGDRLGGRMRSDPSGEDWLNYGAHLVPGPGSPVGQMGPDRGPGTPPVRGVVIGLAVGSAPARRGRLSGLRAPFPLRGPARSAKAPLWPCRGE